MSFKDVTDTTVDIWTSDAAQEFFLGKESNPSLISKGQRKLLKKQLVPFAAQFANAIPNSLIREFPQFEGEFPGSDPLQQMSLAGFEALARGEVPESASELYRTATDTLQTFLEPGEEFDEFFDTVIAGPLLETLEKDIFPQFRLEQAATGNLQGQGSGEGQERIVENAFDALATERTRAGFEVPFQALQLVPSFEQIQPQLLNQIMQAGGVSRDIAIQEYSAALAAYERDLAERNARLDFLFDVATKRTRSPTAGEPGFVQGLLGSEGGGAAGAGEGSGQTAASLIGAFI